MVLQTKCINIFSPILILQENDRTALWYAASVGNVSVVEILLENGAIMDDRDEVEKICSIQW